MKHLYNLHMVCITHFTHVFYALLSYQYILTHVFYALLSYQYLLTHVSYALLSYQYLYTTKIIPTHVFLVT